MNVVHYADDSTVYMIRDLFQSLTRNTNYELVIIDTWFYANKLSWTISKSHCSMFSNEHYNNETAQQIKA